jgi:hypothetical protein
MSGNPGYKTAQGQLKANGEDTENELLSFAARFSRSLGERAARRTLEAVGHELVQA